MALDGPNLASPPSGTIGVKVSTSSVRLKTAQGLTHQNYMVGEHHNKEEECHNKNLINGLHYFSLVQSFQEILAFLENIYITLNQLRTLDQ